MAVEGLVVGGRQPAASSQQRTLHRANKAFKLITTAVYLRTGKKKEKKTADGEKMFSWLLGLLVMCLGLR